ncbi:MAG: ACT domain-containing protein [Gammaproteobacteria bacterium]
MSHYLVISAIGNDRPGIVNSVSQMIVEHKGNITSSRMMAMGGEFSLMLMVEGDSAVIEKIQSTLPDMEASLGLTIVSKHTEAKPGTARVPCNINVVSMDHPGIVQQVADFFSSRDVNIEEMNTDTYPAAHTGTPMFALNMVVSLPADMKVAPLREKFIDFCDALNLDATMEIS